MNRCHVKVKIVTKENWKKNLCKKTSSFKQQHKTSSAKQNQSSVRKQ